MLLRLLARSAKNCLGLQPSHLCRVVSARGSTPEQHSCDQPFGCPISLAHSRLDFTVRSFSAEGSGPEDGSAGAVSSADDQLTAQQETANAEDVPADAAASDSSSVEASEVSEEFNESKQRVLNYVVA